jgi:hypothetical protein
MDSTSRFVEVPMLVSMPPGRIAKLTGMSVREAGWPVRSAMLSMTGSSGVSTRSETSSMRIHDRVYR